MSKLMLVPSWVLSDPSVGRRPSNGRPDWRRAEALRRHTAMGSRRLKTEPRQDTGGPVVAGLEILGRLREQRGVLLGAADDRHGGQSGQRVGVGAVVLAGGRPLV